MIPSALDRAQSLIDNNPELFQDNGDTLSVLVNALWDFKNECNEYLNPPFSAQVFLEMEARIEQITKDHAQTHYRITL